MIEIGPLAASGKILYDKIGKFPFIFGLILIEILVWINGPALFPNWSSGYSNLILTYLVMTVIFYVFSKAKTKQQIQRPLNQSVFAFVAFFIGTTILLSLLVLAGLLTTGYTPHELFWQVVLIQVVVVATAEELMFRGVLLSYLGVIISAALFAFWHSYAYGVIYYQLTFDTFNWPALLLAFVMGIILGIIAKNPKFGLPATIGVHAAYNLVVVGVLIL